MRRQPHFDTRTKYDILSIMHSSAKDRFTVLRSSCQTYRVTGSECDRTRNSAGQRVGLTQLDADTIGDLYRKENHLCKSSLSAGDYTHKGQFPAVHDRVWWPRTTEHYNTIHAVEILPFGCKEPGKASWRTFGGGKLMFNRDGSLVFSNRNGGRIIRWGQGGTAFCFQRDGNLVIYRGGKPIWTAGTFAGGIQSRRAHKILLFDHHWALQTKLKYGHDAHTWSLVRYPPQAPSSIEIIPWNGCLTQMYWHTPGGAELGFKDGNLHFIPGDGQGQRVQPPTWITGTHGAKCITFSKDGELRVWTREGKEFVFTSGTGGARSPHRAVRIVVFDNEWSMFDHDFRVIVTYPPSSDYTRLNP